MASPSASSAASGSSGSSSLQPRESTASSVLRALAEGSPMEAASTGVPKQIDDLLATQRQVRAQRAQVAKVLKNAQRRRERLNHTARLLTAADLASVLVLRQEEEEESTKSSTKHRRSSQLGKGGGKNRINEDRTEEGQPSEGSADDEPEAELAAELENENREEERAAS